jgi:hypothetical protein
MSDRLAEWYCDACHLSMVGSVMPAHACLSAREQLGIDVQAPGRLAIEAETAARPLCVCNGCHRIVDHDGERCYPCSSGNDAHGYGGVPLAAAPREAAGPLLPRLEHDFGHAGPIQETLDELDALRVRAEAAEAERDAWQARLDAASEHLLQRHTCDFLVPDPPVDVWDDDADLTGREQTIRAINAREAPMTEQTPWHAGRTVGRTLYQGDGPDDLIGVMDNRELAAQVVAEHNAAPRLQVVVAAARAIARASAGGHYLDWDEPEVRALLDAVAALDARMERPAPR